MILCSSHTFIAIWMSSVEKFHSKLWSCFNWAVFSLLSCKIFFFSFSYSRYNSIIRCWVHEYVHLLHSFCFVGFFLTFLMVSFETKSFNFNDSQAFFSDLCFKFGSCHGKWVAGILKSAVLYPHSLSIECYFIMDLRKSKPEADQTPLSTRYHLRQQSLMEGLLWEFRDSRDWIC
jgi:hypothetical protein